MFFRQRKKGGSFSAKKLLLIQGFDQFQRFLTQNTCGFSIAAFDHAAIHILSETPMVRRQQGPNGGSESMSWNFHKSNLLQMIFKLFLGWVSYTSFVLVHQIKKKHFSEQKKQRKKSPSSRLQWNMLWAPRSSRRPHGDSGDKTPPASQERIGPNPTFQRGVKITGIRCAVSRSWWKSGGKNTKIENMIGISCKRPQQDIPAWIMIFIYKLVESGSKICWKSHRRSYRR